MSQRRVTIVEIAKEAGLYGPSLTLAGIIRKANNAGYSISSQKDEPVSQPILIEPQLIEREST